MIGSHSNIGGAAPRIIRRHVACAACGSPLGNAWADIAVPNRGALEIQTAICTRCADRAEATSEGVRDILGDIQWRRSNPHA